MKIRFVIPLAITSILFCYCAKPKYASYKENPYRSLRIKKDSLIFEINYNTEKASSKTNGEIEYFWFYNHNIGTSKNTNIGYPLENEFIVKDNNDFLLEKGNLKHGIRDGIWLKWNHRHFVYESQEWKEGKKIGYNKIYDANNRLLFVGRYKREQWSGKLVSLPSKLPLEFLRNTLRIKNSKYKKCMRKLNKKGNQVRKLNSI